MSIKRLIFGILFSLVLQAQGAHHYYPSKVEDILSKRVTLNNDDIKKYLRTVLIRYHADNGTGSDQLVNNCANQKNCYRYKTLSYKQARKHLFGQLHLREDEKGYYVKDVYCNQTYRSEGGSSIGPMKIPNSNILNCEHTWPQSRFNSHEGAGIQKTDLHHLYPTNSKANSIRGNNEFAEVDSNSGAIFPMCDNSYSSSNLREVLGMSPLKRQRYFEPPDEHKGNVARALFYFSIRYLNPISDQEEAFLRKWHNEDPIDEEEAMRNRDIFDIQLSRNPFIDHPELVELISDF